VSAFVSLLPRVEPAGSSTWRSWTDTDVVDVGHAAFATRTYLEQRDVRRYLARMSDEMRLSAAADVGSGYGRLSPVLREVCPLVVGIEREPGLVEQAQALWPTIEFRQTPSLSRLPAEARSFDMALTFTVLQHLVDSVLLEVVGELKRILRHPGFLLLCEETDERPVSGDLTDPSLTCTVGRSVVRYQELLAPMELIETSPRQIEPTYERPNVGTYMLFRTW
jgi:SAM-dependent methyltransferase